MLTTHSLIVNMLNYSISFELPTPEQPTEHPNNLLQAIYQYSCMLQFTWEKKSSRPFPDIPLSSTTRQTFRSSGMAVGGRGGRRGPAPG